MRVLSSLFLGATALVSLPSFAATLTASQILTQFNGVISGDFYSGHDVEGRLVANVVKTGATFYNKPNDSASDFAAINAVTINAGNWNIDNGGSVNYVGSNAATYNFNGDGTLKYKSPDFAISDFTKPLDNLQSQLSKLAINSTVNDKDPNAFTFVETGTTAVFGLTTADLQLARTIKFSGDASTIIINVTGTSFNEGANFSIAGGLSSKIIWNFIDATSISLGTAWEGSILAGDATVTNTNYINGVLYAKNLNGNGELHNVAFTGTLPAVPEPETYAMLLAGLGLMGCVARRKKSV